MNVKDMTPEQIAEITRYKLRGELSCSGCKFLYRHDHGYSNYTVVGTRVLCALDKNPNLDGSDESEEPYDWRIVDGKDNWPRTANSRCERFADTGSHDIVCHLDVDGDDEVTAYDYEAAQAISRHSGRETK